MIRRDRRTRDIDTDEILAQHLRLTRAQDELMMERMTQQINPPVVAPGQHYEIETGNGNREVRFIPADFMLGPDLEPAIWDNGLRPTRPARFHDTGNAMDIQRPNRGRPVIPDLINNIGEWTNALTLDAPNEEPFFPEDTIRNVPPHYRNSPIHAITDELLKAIEEILETEVEETDAAKVLYDIADKAYDRYKEMTGENRREVSEGPDV